MNTIPEFVDKSHYPLWEPFINWCNNNGVSTEDEGDYRAWWECFLAGATTFHLLKTKGVY